MPWGTLVANLVGAYLVGLAFGFFATLPAMPPFWRLFIVTGLLGGLTTFSTFSAETFALLEEGRLAMAATARPNPGKQGLKHDGLRDNYPINDGT
jgi:CrcB protein